MNREDEIKQLKEQLRFYQEFPCEPWTLPKAGMSLTEEIEKIKNQLEVLEELKPKQRR